MIVDTTEPNWIIWNATQLVLYHYAPAFHPPLPRTGSLHLWFNFSCSFSCIIVHAPQATRTFGLVSQFQFQFQLKCAIRAFWPRKSLKLFSGGRKSGAIVVAGSIEAFTVSRFRMFRLSLSTQDTM